MQDYTNLHKPFEVQFTFSKSAIPFTCQSYQIKPFGYVLYIKDSNQPNAIPNMTKKKQSKQFILNPNTMDYHYYQTDDNDLNTTIISEVRSLLISNNQLSPKKLSGQFHALQPKEIIYGNIDIITYIWTSNGFIPKKEVCSTPKESILIDTTQRKKKANVECNDTILFRLENELDFRNQKGILYTIYFGHLLHMCVYLLLFGLDYFYVGHLLFNSPNAKIKNFDISFQSMGSIQQIVYWVRELALLYDGTLSLEMINQTSKEDYEIQIKGEIEKYANQFEQSQIASIMFINNSEKTNLFDYLYKINQFNETLIFNSNKGLQYRYLLRNFRYLSTKFINAAFNISKLAYGDFPSVRLLAEYVIANGMDALSTACSQQSYTYCVWIVETIGKALSISKILIYISIGFGVFYFVLIIFLYKIYEKRVLPNFIILDRIRNKTIHRLQAAHKLFKFSLTNNSDNIAYKEEEIKSVLLTKEEAYKNHSKCKLVYSQSSNGYIVFFLCVATILLVTPISVAYVDNKMYVDKFNNGLTYYNNSIKVEASTTRMINLYREYVLQSKGNSLNVSYAKMMKSMGIVRSYEISQVLEIVISLSE